MPLVVSIGHLFCSVLAKTRKQKQINKPTENTHKNKQTNKQTKDPMTTSKLTTTTRKCYFRLNVVLLPKHDVSFNSKYFPERR